MTERKDNESDDKTLDVLLAVARWRHLFWGGLSLLAGVMVGLHMGGAIGYLLGAALAVTGLLSLRSFAVTFLHPAGTISVGDRDLELPPKVCAGTTVKMPVAELQNAYLLHRHTPWNTTGPVLVVETRRGVFEYPRDWFAADTDQRRLMRLLNRRLGRI